MSRWFKDELDRLQEFREIYAREYPDIAQFTSKAFVPDPDVERLFEGFAYLTSRLREKLEDDLPELVQSFMALWWPHYLRPTPSCTVLQYTPILGAITQPVRVAAGVEADSITLAPAASSAGVRCRFRTASELFIFPLELKKSTITTHDGHDGLELDLELWPTAACEENAHQYPLRLYFEPQVSGGRGAFFDLNRSLAAIDISFLKNDQSVDSQTIDKTRLQSMAIGGSGTCRLFPHADSVPDGLALLQEYFAFREHFFFVDLTGFGKILARAIELRADRVTVFLRFASSASRSNTVTNVSAKLNCAPAVNLSTGAVRPIRHDRSKTEYTVYPEPVDSDISRIYSVDRVRGVVSGTTQVRDYERFESFAPHLRASSATRFYTVRVYQDNVALRFPGTDHRDAQETVSISATISNGNYPALLNIGDVCIPTSTSPDFATFENISIPTEYLPAPVKTDLLWTMLSNLSLNYQSLCDVDVLRSVIRSYDIRSQYVEALSRSGRTRKIVDTIDVRAHGQASELIGRHLARGFETEIYLSSEPFEDLGEYYVFAACLDQMFASFAGVNSFHRLSVLDNRNRWDLQWPARTGTRQAL